MDSSLEITGNDAEYESLLFKEFENINGIEYQPLTKGNVDSIVGRYKKGILGFKNEVPEKLGEIEFRSDGKIIPENEMAAWEYHDKNMIMTYHPYEAMPEYDVPAGVEQQAKYVFLAIDSSSMILSNSDGSVREIYIRF
jgi:hypothetical protein